MTPVADTGVTADDAAARSCFRLQTRDGRTFQGRKLLLATGTRDRLPPLQGLRECYGISAHHCPYCDAWEHRDEHLLAYGEEPDAAVGLGLLLTGWSQHVTVLTHGKPLAAEDRRRALRGKLAINDDPIVRLLHTEGRLHGVQLGHGSPLPAKALFFNTNQRPQSDLPQLLGCEMENSFATHTGRRQTTNVPGLFMAGDAGGEVQFAIVAASEGAIAAVAINHQLLQEDGA